MKIKTRDQNQCKPPALWAVGEVPSIFTLICFHSVCSYPHFRISIQSLLSKGGGGTQNLPRIVGPAIAKELIFTGRAVSGTKAQEIGLVNHVVEQVEQGDAAYHKSLDLAAEIVTQG